MYEKPQYLTPDGYKRSDKNPLGAKKEGWVKRAEDKKRLQTLLKKRQATNTGQPSKFVMSEKSAQLIAEVIKGMLNERP